MTARTLYKEPSTHEEALAELRRVSGTQCEPALVDAFIETLEVTGLRFGHAGAEDFSKLLDDLVSDEPAKKAGWVGRFRRRAKDTAPAAGEPAVPAPAADPGKLQPVVTLAPPVQEPSSPFQIRGFRALLSTYAIAEIGDLFAIVALAVLVFEQTESPYAVAAAFFVGKFLPALAATALTARLAPLRGVVSLTGLLLAQVACYAALAWIAHTDPRLEFLLPVLLLEGLFAVTARGLSRGVMAMTLIGDEVLRRGNAIINIVFGVGTVTGPVLAVLVLERWSAAVALASAGVAFALCALVLVIDGRDLPTAEHRDEENDDSRHSVIEGLRYVRDSPVARRLVGGQAFAVAFWTLIIPIEVVYVSDSLHESASAFGWLLAAWGAGILVGSAVFARTRLPLNPLIAVSTALIGVGYLGMAVAPTLAFALTASAVGGLGNGMQWVAVLTALQQSVSPRFYARASGLMESVMSGVPGIAYPVGAFAAAAAGPREAYAISGAGVVAVAAYWALTARKRDADALIAAQPSEATADAA